MVRLRASGAGRGNREHAGPSLRESCKQLQPHHLFGSHRPANGEALGFRRDRVDFTLVRRIERGAGAPSFDAIEALAAGLVCTVVARFATMTDRDVAAAVIQTMLSSVWERELCWL